MPSGTIAPSPPGSPVCRARPPKPTSKSFRSPRAPLQRPQLTGIVNLEVASGDSAVIPSSAEKRCDGSDGKAAKSQTFDDRNQAGENEERTVVLDEDCLGRIADLLFPDFVGIARCMRVSQSWRRSFSPVWQGFEPRLSALISALVNGEELRRSTLWRERRRSLRESIDEDDMRPVLREIHRWASYTTGSMSESAVRNLQAINATVALAIAATSPTIGWYHDSTSPTIGGREWAEVQWMFRSGSIASVMKDTNLLIKAQALMEELKASDPARYGPPEPLTLQQDLIAAGLRRQSITATRPLEWLRVADEIVRAALLMASDCMLLASWFAC